MGAIETSTSAETNVGVPWRSPVLATILAATLMTPMDVPLLTSSSA